MGLPYHSVRTSCKPPSRVTFRDGHAVTTLADVAKEQAARVGRRIRERRDELGLTQAEVAARMVDSPSTNDQQVSKWERGEHRPNDDNLEILAQALETTLADLVSGPLGERDGRPAATPDPFASNGGDPYREQLDRIEARLKYVMDTLEWIGEEWMRVITAQAVGEAFEPPDPESRPDAEAA